MRNNEFAVKRGCSVSPHGSPIHDIYSPKVQQNGSIKLEKVGEENTDEIIESYAASCSLEAILARFASGDTGALNRYDPQYADVSEIPKTLAGCMQLVIDAEKSFDALPVSVKSQFNNSWREWLATSGTEAWYDVMSAISPSRSQSDLCDNTSPPPPPPASAQPAAEREPS